MTYFLRPNEANVILALGADELVSPEELVARTGLTPSVVVSVVDGLAQRGLVDHGAQGDVRISREGKKARAEVAGPSESPYPGVFVLDAAAAEKPRSTMDEIDAALDDVLGPPSDDEELR